MIYYSDMRIPLHYVYYNNINVVTCAYRYTMYIIITLMMIILIIKQKNPIQWTYMSLKYTNQ